MRDLLRRNATLLALAASVGLAWVFPDAGARGGMLHSALTVKAAIFTIFLVQGLSLPTETVWRGLAAWRLHVATEILIFAVMPALALALVWAGGDLFAPAARAGFIFLGFLPTTIATAVALVAHAEGNVTGALFNTLLSNICGVLIVPAAMAMWASVSGVAIPLGAVLAELSVLIILPLILGQVCRLRVREFMDRRKVWTRRINSWLILFIVYVAFCNSVKDDVWVTSGWNIVAVSGVGALLLLATGTAAAMGAARVARLDAGDSAAAIFCGSQKTLAAGIPMAQAIFGGREMPVGVIVLPLLFYHLLQLTLGVILSERMRRAREAGRV